MPEFPLLKIDQADVVHVYTRSLYLLHPRLKRHLYTVMSMHKPDSLAALALAMPHIAIVLEKVEYRLRQSHLGFKSSSYTARS
jgi:hypothetical protein